MQKNLIISLLVLVLILGSLLVWQILQKPETPKAEETPAPEVYLPPVAKPSEKTAAKYFPAGGNAIDFREDGSSGDFLVELERKGDKIKVKWSEDIKVSGVKVYNLGKLWNLQDHRIVWDLGNFDIKNPSVVEPGTQLPETTVFLSSPYEISKIPEGFFNNTFYSEEFPKGSPIFVKGDRYSIEVYGQDKDDKFVTGSYTFDY